MDSTHSYKILLFSFTFTHIFQVGCFDFKETVITTCPDSHISGKAANITIVSNGIDFTAVAYCSGDEEHGMQVLSSTVKYLPVYFHSDPPSTDACIFLEDLTRPGYYYITVNMVFSIFSGLKTMHCAYDPNAASAPAEDTANQTIFKGPPGVSDISLEVTDFDGNAIQQTFEAGRYIRLRGYVTQLRGNETGIQAMNCVAGSQDTSETISILEGGCGNGDVIPKGQGFVSSGLETLSAPFKSFALISTGQIYYNCTFTLCTGNASCSGSSCYTNGTVVTSLRKRRSVAFESIDDMPVRQLHRMGMMAYGTSGGHVLFSKLPNDKKASALPANKKRDKLIGLAITLSIISIVLTMALIIYLCFRDNDSSAEFQDARF